MKKLIVINIISLLGITLLITCKKKEQEKDLQAGFTYHSIENCYGTTPCRFKFKNTSSITGDPAYKWDFGDNSTITDTNSQRNPEHTFINGEEFEVTLTVQYPTTSKQHKETIKIIDSNPCDSVNHFICAKKLSNDIFLKDLMNTDKKKYYYFDLDTPGAVMITLEPTPTLPLDGQYELELFENTSTGTNTLLTEFRDNGENIITFDGPLFAKQYYIKFTQTKGEPSKDPFRIKYKFLKTDLNELNQTFSTATEISSGVPVKGTILASGDKDYYKIATLQPCVLDLEISPIPNLGKNRSLYVSVYNNPNSNSKLKELSSTNPGEKLWFSVGPVNGGDYYILVDASGGYSTDQYNLKVTIDTSDKNEINSSFITATNLNLGQKTLATIKSGGDKDYYKFTAIADTNVTIEIDEVPSGIGYMEIYLYDEQNSNSQIDFEQAASGQTLLYKSKFNLLKGKTYFIRAKSYYSNAESNDVYGLTITQ